MLTLCALRSAGASMQNLHNRFVRQVGIRHVGRFEEKLSNVEMSTFSGTATRASRCRAYIIFLLLRSKLELDTCTLKMRGYKEGWPAISHVFQCWLIRLNPQLCWRCMVLFYGWPLECSTSSYGPYHWHRKAVLLESVPTEISNPILLIPYVIL